VKLLETSNRIKKILFKLVFNFNPTIQTYHVFWGNELRLNRAMTLLRINKETAKFLGKIVENGSLYHDPYYKNIELDLFNIISLRNCVEHSLDGL
jgi:hypothetical protein